MKKIILSAFTIVLIAGAAQAQTTGRQTDEKKQEHQLPFKQLNLTDAQKNQIQAIRLQEKQELSTLKKKDNMVVKDWKAQRKQIHQKFKSQFRNVLTPQQKDQLAKLKAEHHKNGHFAKDLTRAGKDGQAGKQRGKFLADLNLTHAQKTQMQQLRKDTKSKIQAIRNNSSLSQDLLKAQTKALRKDQKQQMKSILTPDQLQKLQSKMKERRNSETK